MKAIILAAVTLFGGVAFAEQAEAGSVFPEGTYEQDDRIRLQVTSDGDYKIRLIENGYARGSGFALKEGTGVCNYGSTKGNLWTVDYSGKGQCYNASVRGNRLIIQSFTYDDDMGGIWIKQ